MLYRLNADAVLTACINKEAGGRKGGPVGPRNDCAWVQNASIKGVLRHWDVQKSLLLVFGLDATALSVRFIFQVSKLNFLNIDFSPVSSNPPSILNLF